jgi:predicted lipase
MIRKFITIKGKNFDLWEVKSIEPHKDFPEHADDWEYSILLNREGIATNINAVHIPCDSEEDMEDEIQKLKERLGDDESILFI